MAIQTKQVARVDHVSDEAVELRKHLRKIADVLAGEERIKDCGEVYLPKYPKESYAAYKRRLANTPWRPELANAIGDIVGQVFRKPVKLVGENADKASSNGISLADWAGNVDGQGSSLHVFARSFFRSAVEGGVAAILVDYPSGQLRTLADEREAKRQPYWSHINAGNILAAYWQTEHGHTFLRHIRFIESEKVQDGYGETEVERVRVFNRTDGAVTFEVWKQVTGSDNQSTWELENSGTISVPFIPVAFLWTGERCGNFSAKPPMLALADMNLELYRAMSRKEQIQNLAGSPMLKIRGASVDDLPRESDDRGRKVPVVEVGPDSVLSFPQLSDGAIGDADYIQPNSDNLVEIRKDVEARQADILRLAKQPLQPQSGTVTATQNALSASKSNSAIAAWAFNLKDALDLAIDFTCQWMGIENSGFTASVPTDFSGDVRPDTDVPQLIALNTTGRLSTPTLWRELQRRGTLGPDFDADTETHLIETEGHTHTDGEAA